ncbi:hypothetical protein [Halosegnis marinus]|uniref:DUF8052 domain-containing protein n=1 Tax=Halosegnis marinus TaxID=3034023 RepID=A0ABD5ZPX2_9EURY|nr:hypothetical protein [Halosegnis sp. DT85]
MSRDDEGEPELDRPEWDDEYLDRVAERLMYHYDLEKDERVRDRRFPLVGRLLMESRKQFLHPSLNYARENAREHLFVDRIAAPTVADLDRLVELGHALADLWIEADEEHRSTEFTFVVLADDLGDEVREHVSGFRDRTLLKYGYYGHYEVNLVVVAPGAEAYVASSEADVWRAFAPWADEDPDPEPGLVARLRGLFGRSE